MRVGASFRVHGVPPADVTATLGCEPSTVNEEDGGLWTLVEPIVEGSDLGPLISVLLGLLDDAPTGAFDELRARGAEFDFFCFIESSAVDRAVILSPTICARLAAIPAELWLDVCGSD